MRAREPAAVAAPLSGWVVRPLIGAIGGAAVLACLPAIAQASSAHETTLTAVLVAIAVLLPLGVHTSLRGHRGLHAGLMIAATGLTALALTAASSQSAASVVLGSCLLLQLHRPPRTPRDVRALLVTTLGLLAVGLASAGEETTAFRSGVALAWAVAAGLTLHLSARPDATSGATTRRRGPLVTRRAVGSIGAVVGLALLFAALAPAPPLHGLARGVAGHGGAGPGPRGAAGGGPTSPIPSDGGLPLDLRVRGTLPTTPVALVFGAPGGTLLRNGVYDTYDGQVWTETGSIGRDTSAPGPVMTIDVRPLQPMRTVLSAGRLVSAAGPWNRLVELLGTWYASPSLPVGETYGSRGMTPGPSAGPEAPAEPATTVLPTELPSRVRDLARTWTDGATTVDAKVRAIEQHLRVTMTYTLKAPVPPAGHDAVDDLLFVSHEGFCEQFASAEAVLLRTLNIPTRVVVGYALPGAVAPGTGAQIIGSDAHAWVDVWHPGRGWVESDPTAGVPLAPETSRSAAPHLVLVGLFAAAALGLLVGAVLIGRRRRRAASTPVRPPVVSAYLEVLDALDRAGRSAAEGATPREVLATVPGGVPPSAVRVLEQVLWSDAAPPDAVAARAHADLVGVASGIDAATKG